MTRVLVAGFLHETNTFASTPARWENFVNGEGFPGMHLNEEVWSLASVNVPAGGFMSAAPDDWILLPVIWCAASPSGPVEAETFERITGLITDACAEASPDAVYLDLHGAMVSQEHADADGEILHRVRQVVGPDVPIVVSLDLHANVSDRMLQAASAMVAYRTYPHVDMAETGRRVAVMLDRLLTGEQLSYCAERIEFLVPTISGSTLTGPAQAVYANLPKAGDAMASIAMAFPASDVEECQPCVFAYGSDETALKDIVAEIAGEITRREHEFQLDARPVHQVFDQVEQAVVDGLVPVVVADTQDNPGAGGDATTTGLLIELVRRDLPGSALAAMWAPDVVKAAAEAGVGANVAVTFGASSSPGDHAYTDTFEVLAVTDGKIRFDGPMMHGNVLSVGPSVLLRKGNVQVVVNSHKAQIVDRNQFRGAGLVPEDQQVLVVKSSVHFRADYEEMAAKILVALAAGPFPADPAELPWQNLRPGIRVRPLGPTFNPAQEPK